MSIKQRCQTDGACAMRFGVVRDRLSFILHFCICFWLEENFNNLKQKDLEKFTT